MSTTEAPENNEPGPLLGLGSGAGLGLAPERNILRAAVDEMTAAKAKLRELDGREPDVWQYATGIVGVAMHKAVAAERERICAALPGGHSVDPQWVADMVRGLRA